MATAGEKPPVGIDNGVESGDAVKPQKEDAKISDRLRSQKPKTAESPNQPATSHQGEASETKQETKQEAKQEDSKTLPELRVLYPQHSSSVPRVDIVAIHDLGETLDKAWIYRRKQRKRQNDSLLSRVTAPTKSAPPGEGGRPGSDGSPVPGPSKGKPPTSLSAIRHFLDRGDPPDMAGLVDGAVLPVVRKAGAGDSRENETANPAGPSTQPAGRPTSPRDGQPSAGQSNNPTAPEQGTRNLAAGRANDIPSDRPSTDRGSARGVNWLIDALMLPAEVPGVRVMCYEYTCPDVAAKDPSKFLRDTAVDLLHRLRHKRPTAEKGYAQVPIIFIGLGLGALIAQQAIVNLQIPSDGKPDSEADTVLDIVAGVLLLDAPSPQISDPNFPLSRSQASKKSWTDDWFVSPASSSLPTTKIDALSLWIEFSAASSAKKICLSWYYDPAKGGENARIHRDDIMLLGKVSDTAHRLSRFDGPGDVDYKSLVNIIKRSILVRYCSTKSLKWHFLDVSKYMYSFRLRDQQGLTPLHVAAEAGNLTAVKALTNKDATLIREKDNDWRPPLTTAIRRAARQIGEQTQSEEETKSSFAPIIKFLVKSDPSSGLQLENRDRFGFLPWRYATGDENQWIRRLKKKLVEGNSLAENHVMERVLVPEPGSAQSKACDAFDVILVEVFLEKNRNRTKEKFNRDFSSVTDIIYNGKDGVSRILDESRPDNSPRSKVFCRWVHLPSNNEQWVRDLLISMGYQDGSMGGQRHEGKQIIDRYMTPQAKRYVHSHGFTDENEPTEKPATLRHERSSETGKTITLQPSDVAASGNTPVSPIPNSPYPGGKESNAIVIFLPILGFETHRHRKYLSEAIKRAAGVATSHGDAMLPTKDSIKRTGLSPEAQSNESLVLDGYLNSDEVKPVHCRRTLDQFAYYMLESTEFRDSSQVAYRWAKNTGACSKAKDRPIIMVDQLWLWLLHDGTVISSFPSTWGDDDDFDHMKVLVNELGKNKERPGMERPLIRSAEHLLHILLRTSLDFGKRNGPAGFRFEDCFLSSINNVAEKQNGLFQKFRKVIEALENDKISPKDKKDQMKALFRLDEETGLLVEITDILDELTIIKTVLTQQQAVIQDLVQLYLKARDEDEDSEGDNADETQSRGGFRASNAPAEGSASQQGGKIQKQKEVNPKPTPSLSRTENTAKTQQEPARTQASLPAKSEGAEKGAQKNKRVELLQHRDLIFGTSAIVENHIRVTKDMLGMAEGVRESLKALLDLKQKHANGWEARFSREGSEATQWQGNVILFFTIVTAIFLPLSFMASFFALSIDVFPKDTTSQQTSWPLNRVCSYLFGISAAIFTPLVLIALYVNEMSAAVKQAYQRLRGKGGSGGAASGLSGSARGRLDEDHDSDVETVVAGVDIPPAGSHKSHSPGRNSRRSPSPGARLTSKGYARLFGVFTFHAKIPWVRRLWKMQRYQVKSDRRWHDKYVYDYPLHRFFFRIRRFVKGALFFMLVLIVVLLLRRGKEKKEMLGRRQERSDVSSSYWSPSEYETDSDDDRRSRSRSRYRYRSRSGSRRGERYGSRRTSGSDYLYPRGLYGESSSISDRAAAERGSIKTPSRRSSRRAPSDGVSVVELTGNTGVEVLPPSVGREGRSRGFRNLFTRSKKRITSPDTEMGGGSPRGE